MRTFDGTKCKVGDVVCDEGKYTGTIIDINPSAGDHAVAVRWHHNKIITTYTLMGHYCVGSTSPSIYLPDLDPLDEVDPSPGNIAKLTRRQVGEGYRIPAHDEVQTPDAEYWNYTTSEWLPRSMSPRVSYTETDTYRVPIKPTMVPLEASDIKLGRTLVRDSEATRLVTSVYNTSINIAGLGHVCYTELSEYMISFDHGETWQRAEKAAPHS